MKIYIHIYIWPMIYISEGNKYDKYPKASILSISSIMDLNIFSTEFNFDSPWMIGGWIGIQFEKKTNLSDTLRTRGTQTMLGNSIYMWFTWWYSFYEKSICIGQLSVWTKIETFGWEVFILSWYMLTIWQSWIRCHINVCISWPPLSSKSKSRRIFRCYINIHNLIFYCSTVLFSD